MRPCHTYTKRSFILEMRIHEVNNKVILICSCAFECIKNVFFRFHSLEWLHHLSKKYTIEMCECFFTNASQLKSIRLSYKRSALKGGACAANLFRGMADWIFLPDIALNRPFLVLISSMFNKPKVERTSLRRCWSYIGMCCYRWKKSTRHSFLDGDFVDQVAKPLRQRLYIFVQGFL